MKDYDLLPWLVEAPAEFRKICNTLADQSTIKEEKLRQLASYRLNNNQLVKLAKLLKLESSIKAGHSALPQVRLGILSNATTEIFAPILEGSALRHGIRLQTVQTSFDQTMLQALDSGSEINALNIDAVLVAEDYRTLNFIPCLNDKVAATAQIDLAVNRLRAIIAGLKSIGNKVVFVQTMPGLPYGLMGSADTTSLGSVNSMISSYNNSISHMARNNEIIQIDIAELANAVGRANWHDAGIWYHAKLAFAQKYLPLYGEIIGRVLASLKGKTRRCLILDLDNTIWGGVIGDDGLEGIDIGQGTATGEAFLNVQRAALELRERGIALAVCSKNTEGIAKTVFDEHPDMLLRLEHFAGFFANWDDKAGNIIKLSKELNLGLDSFVFLDDNPAERFQVRESLPMVAVPELGTDPSEYSEILLAAGYFEITSLTDEDVARADAYSANKQRNALEESVVDISSYLQQLDMSMTVEPFSVMNRDRVTQLVNKTNQFNLMTSRYNEVEISNFESSSNTYSFAIRLKDRFGQQGLICVVICIENTQELSWIIDTWLMSCRVLKRCVEMETLNQIVLAAQLRGIKKLIGIFKPSGRNELVRNHYKELGFSLVEKKIEGTDQWELIVDDYDIKSTPVRIEEI